jgi:Dna[CI] antecedent, DciA
MNKESMQQAGGGLEKIVAQSLRQAPAPEAPVLAWPVVCGSTVAERTRALKFVDGVLHVAVADAGWKRELQALAPRYIATINRYTVETVRRIDFVVAQSESSGSNQAMR